MSEWNLSVRLTGQGAQLARTLRDTARDARTVSRDINALKRDISELRHAARRPIRLRVDATVNARGLRREVTSAIRTAQAGQRVQIPITLLNPRQLRRDVSAAIRFASAHQTLRVRVVADTTGLRTPVPVPGVPGGGAPAAAATAKALGSLLPITTALVPLVAGLSSSILSAAGSMGIGGVAAIAYGAALAGQLGPLKEAAEAEKAYDDAVREHGRGSRQAAQAQLTYQRQLASMPPETQKAAVALSRLKGQFGEWSDDLSGFTMEPVTKGFAVLGEVLPHLTPEVKSFSTSMDRLMTVAGGAINTSTFDALSEKAAELTDAKLDDFTDSVIHLLRVVSEGNTDAGVIGQVLRYMRENGPAAREALNSVGDAVGNLLDAASQAGPSMLTLATVAADLVAAIPPQAVAVILQAAFALKALTLAGAAAGAVASGISAVRAAILGLSAASAAAGGGLAGLRAAFLSLGTAAKASVVVAGISLAVVAISKLMDMGKQAPPDVDKLTTSLRRLGATGKVTGEAASAFGKDLDGLYDRVRSLTDPSTTDDVQQFITTLGGIGDWDSTPVKEAKETIDAIDESLANLVKNGQADLAAEALKELTAEYGKSGADTSKFTEQMDGYQSALKDVQLEQELTARSMGTFGRAAQDVQAQLSAQKRAADGLRESLIALNETNRSAHDAEVAFERAMDDLTEAFKENGNTLDVHTKAGQDNRMAMSQAAAAQDELIVSGIAAGESFETMSKKSKTLRAEMLELATKGFGGNKKKAEEYVNTLLGTPAQVDTMIRLEREQAIRGLEEVRTAIQATPDAHEITVDTLNASAIAALEAVGLKTEQLPDGKTRVYTANGESLGAIGAVSTALNRLDGQTAHTYTVHTTSYKIVGKPGGPPSGTYFGSTAGRSADGNIYGRARALRFADGGTRENHVAQIAQPTYRMWAEPETGGEAYIPFAPAKRGRSRAIAEETVKRLGGDPRSIDWYADGGISGWQFDPVSGSLYSPSDAGRAGHKTKKVKGKSVDYFDLGAVEKKLWKLGEATAAWNRNLEKVADRAGGDVARALASMGEDGLKLAEKMAKGSDKYVAQMSIALRRMEQEARARLSDFTSQLDHDTGNNRIFQDNLAKLAAMGYGDLASYLASQNDQTARELAAEAAGSKAKAKKANEEVKQRKAQLSPDEMSKLIDIIAAISSKSVGIHQVAGKTGLGEDEIIEVGNKAKAKLSQLLGPKAQKFLADLVKANKGQAYENGGIRAGMYATQGGIVRFAEPSTRGEAYIPLGVNKRASATRVLSDVATRFGLGLTDGQAGRVVVIKQDSPLIGQQTNHFTAAGNMRDFAREVESRQGYQLRRLARGGVASRG